MSASLRFLLLFFDRFIERFVKTVVSVAIASLDGRRAPIQQAPAQAFQSTFC
ncbi:hypothetical protein [Pseudomonas sp. BF-R-19]|uniref:hypothetical protein n=1 Tax=Pseudomonas sp. BF-R-19 TaxID=2832397 RepID=UPI001CC0EB28|nr:hypothetical protein [Pseudomonas sp. BF-R-19]